jgi:hypothetical protein
MESCVSLRDDSFAFRLSSVKAMLEVSRVDNYHYWKQTLTRARFTNRTL